MSVTSDGVENGPADRSGEYVVVARRYRPQTFSDLIGQDTVSQALRNAIGSDRVGHAYLFTGARGVGKTSAARILAKALNCDQGPTVTPCGECDACQQIAAGEDVDVLEIDGASNRGIDEIRQLRSNVGIRPSRSRFKVYIIDEVHMLTKEAFNALLKTLEEPPEHVKFVFCTTEPGKIPITVLSRCQRFDFAPVPTDKIVHRLQQIVQQEGAQADGEALQLLARRAAGSMRDSQSLLEQLLSFVGERITANDVHAMLGTARDERLQALVRPLIERDAAGALTELGRSIDEGVDAGQLAEQLVGCLRDMIAALIGCDGDTLLHHPPSELDELKQRAESWGLESLLAAVQILDQAVTRMRQSVQSRMLLELAIVRIARLEQLDELAALVRQLERTPDENEPVAKVAKKAAKKKTAPPMSRLDEPLAMAQAESPSSAAAESLPTGTVQRETPAHASDEVSPSAREDALSDSQLASIWKSALDSLNDMTADCASHADCVAISGPNRLVVRFRAMYNSSKSYCERPERREMLETAVSQVAGRPVRLDFQLLKEDRPHSAPARPIVSQQKRKRQLANHPMVERAMELFEAEVISVDVNQDDTQTSS